MKQIKIESVNFILFLPKGHLEISTKSKQSFMTVPHVINKYIATLHFLF